MNNDNLYSIEDEEDNPIYNIEGDEASGACRGYVLDDDNEKESEVGAEIISDIDEDSYPEEEAWRGEIMTEEDNASNSKISPLLIMLKTLSNPVEGWKSLKRSKFSTDAVAAKCFYPLVALAAVSEYTALFYDAESSVTTLLVPAIITFITFFFGYFSALLLGGIALSKDAKKTLQTDFGKEFVMINMSTLTLFYIIYRLFPLAGPILAFLPLWTIYAICKGTKQFRVSKDEETRVSAILSAIIIGCPILWNWIFNELLPIETI